MNVLNYTPCREYTSEVMDIPDGYDGSVDLMIYRLKVRKYLKYETARRSSLLRAKSKDGSPLYRMTDSGAIVRTRPLADNTRRMVLARDHSQCVLCGSSESLEVDHIIRYIDDGGNDLDNLRTLCHRCHSKRGGRR